MQKNQLNWDARFCVRRRFKMLNSMVTFDATLHSIYFLICIYCGSFAAHSTHAQMPLMPNGVDAHISVDTVPKCVFALSLVRAKRKT